MKQEQALLEALKAANPVAGPDEVDPHELLVVLSAIEERRGAVTTPTPNLTETEAEPTQLSGRTEPQRSWRPAVAFIVALALVLATLGFVTLLLRGNAEVAPPVGDTDVTTTVTSSAGESDATDRGAAESPPPSPTEPPLEPTVRLLSSQPEFFSSLALTTEGLPLVASFIDEGDFIGKGRLFFCEDPMCDNIEIVEAINTIWPGHTDGLTMGGPGGAIYFSFGNTSWRYHDGTAQGMPNLIVGAEQPTAFGADGNPVLLGFITPDEDPDVWSAPAEIVLVACRDALCSAAHTTVLATTSSAIPLHGPFVGSDGSISAVFGLSEPITPPDPEAGYDGADFDVKTVVAHCAEATCADGVVSTEVARGINLRPRMVRRGSDGNLAIWMLESPRPDGREAYGFSVVECGDPACSGDRAVEGPIRASAQHPIRFEDFATDGTPIGVYLEMVYDPEEYAAAAESETKVLEAELGPGPHLDSVGPGDLQPLGMNVNVARCADPVCATYEVTTIAVRNSWSYLHVLDVEVGRDGTIYVLVTDDVNDAPPVDQRLEEPGMRIHRFPEGNLAEVAPLEGTAVVVQ